MAKRIDPTPSQINEMHDLTAVGKTRADIAKALGVSRATIGNWITRDDEFRDKHKTGKMAYAEKLVEDLMGEADKPLPSNPKMASAEIQRRRLKADNIKWIACKLIPNTYGDRVDVSGEVTHVVSALTQLRALESGPSVVEQPKTVTIETKEVMTASDCI